MATAQRVTGTQPTYLQAIRETLTAAICLQNFASQKIERHNKPEVEVRLDKELLLNPVVISRNEQERILIEGSVNSVRVSIKIKQSDEMDEMLADRFSRFLMQRAEDFEILRRKAKKGYDISILITNFNVEEMWKHKLIDFIIEFLQDIDSEISSMKLNVNSRSRVIAKEWLKSFT
ncbi:actin related protein 2/3 complex, subunit 4, 20kDa [Reticulomyxa filosa]|uniref:Actin-related protein 2/3 complex subunit 4 n=1 Tax=Reticulomyxa filosa TaxID=46433 RepID=X6N7J7_RETFI|nr:actin related protein 2/3 complex, subunit 4, 20kDa [Reticulomyxa filosa]|eukprot:ETO21729.1 actin related protein 2/3 complex, subunit 4, 20kDa [Reticulomyxa filosa]